MEMQTPGRGFLAAVLAVASLISTQGHAVMLSVTSDGSDGAFDPAMSLTLSDPRFDFTAINIAPGIDVEFTAAAGTDFLGTGDIFLAGVLNAGTSGLRITTPGDIVISGDINVGSLILEANTITLSGSITADGDVAISANGSTSVGSSGTISSNGVTISSGEILQLITTGQPINIGSGSIEIQPIVGAGPLTIVPVPAAVWLFGAGVFGLVSATGRRPF